MPAPTYNFGEIVKIKEKEEEAVITDIMWHYGKQQHYYFVSVRNKIKSKRYSESEFVASDDYSCISKHICEIGGKDGKENKICMMK